MIVIGVYNDNVCVIDSLDNTYIDIHGIRRNKNESPNDLVGVWMPRKDYVNQSEIGTQLSMDLFISEV